MRQQVSHQPCQRKDGDTDTLQYGRGELPLMWRQNFLNSNRPSNFNAVGLKLLIDSISSL